MWIVKLEPVGKSGAPPEVRLRRALKALLRSFGLLALSVAPAEPDTPPAEPIKQPAAAAPTFSADAPPARSEAPLAAAPASTAPRPETPPRPWSDRSAARETRGKVPRFAEYRP